MKIQIQDKKIHQLEDHNLTNEEKYSRNMSEVVSKVEKYKLENTKLQ